MVIFMITIHFFFKIKKLILRFILKLIVLQGAGPHLNTLPNANIPYNISGMSHYIITTGLRYPHMLLRYSVHGKKHVASHAHWSYWV